MAALGGQRGDRDSSWMLGPWGLIELLAVLSTDGFRFFRYEKFIVFPFVSPEMKKKRYSVLNVKKRKASREHESACACKDFVVPLSPNIHFGPPPPGLSPLINLHQA